jgi:filamentous hemagglutinin family protein
MKKICACFSESFGLTFLIRLITLNFIFLAFDITRLSSVAQAQVVLENAVGNEIEQTKINGVDAELIVGGGARRESNLFYSFRQFNVPDSKGVYFANPAGVNNIIGLVVGGKISNIEGKLGVYAEAGVPGNANLFLINPSGIIFEKNSSLDLKGSFVATTANGVQFGNQGIFDATTSSNPPFLTVNPSGLIFSRESIASIVNKSQVSVGTRREPDPSLSIAKQTVRLSGLKVPEGKTLMLLGGDVQLNNGGLYALGGKVEIGSVASRGVVGLSLDNQNFNLNFPQDIVRGNISFTNGSRVDTSDTGTGSGTIQVIGNNVTLKDKSQIVSSTLFQNNGGDLTLDAADTLEITGPSLAGGNIFTTTYSEGTGGNINIAANKLVLRNGALVKTGTFGSGKGGKINVNASESVEISGDINGPSIIFSSTFSSGQGGDIRIKTGDLLVNEGGGILSGGNAYVAADKTVIYPSGDGGEISVSADNSVRVEQRSGITATNDGTGKAGDIRVVTSLLNVQQSSIEVSSTDGEAGDLRIDADTLTLNEGELLAETGIGGANITLNLLNILRLENESKISADANASANGGNITIVTPILLALPQTEPNGSDIKAKADRGKGGDIVINSQGIFGIKQRKAIPGNQTNDIDASSQFGQSGQVQINTTTDPSQGLVELPTTVVDPDSLVAQNPCKRGSESEFTRSGRGGLPPSLSQDFNSDATQVGLVEPVQSSTLNSQQTKALEGKTSFLASAAASIAPAQGWVFNDKGKVVLVSYNPKIANPQRLKTNPAGCPIP